MKKLKLLSLMVIAGLLMAGCEDIDNTNSNNGTEVSTTVNTEIKTESSNSGTASTESIIYDKDGIEKILKESENIPENDNMKWSPCGNEIIYYTTDGQANYSLYLWETGKEQPEKLNIDVFGGIRFSWSPNSEYILVENGTTKTRRVILINKYGDEIQSFDINNIKILDQLWSDDSNKIAYAKCNEGIVVLPHADPPYAFDIVVYDVNNMTEKTILESTATEYYTFEKWVDNNTLKCNKYSPQNGELGSVVEDINVNIN